MLFYYLFIFTDNSVCLEYLLLSDNTDLGLISFRQNIRDVRAFTWNTPTCPMLLPR